MIGQEREIQPFQDAINLYLPARDDEILSKHLEHPKAYVFLIKLSGVPVHPPVYNKQSQGRKNEIITNPNLS